MKPQFDTYQEVTDAIIQQIEAGTKPWAKEWQGGALQMPHRVTGEAYRGINVLLLWMSAQERQLDGKHWMTFKQAIELGGCVRKGEKATRIVFFKKLERTETGPDGEDRDVSIPMLRTYAVFNSAQIDGLPDRFAAPAFVPNAIERDAQVEQALRSCGADIREGGPSAYYEPQADRVTMPDFERFATSGGYLATLAHELCHWTGHRTRLDRFGANTSTSYAAEELVAELGAAFIGSRLGIVGEHIDNHAAYLSHWLKALRDDKRAIFKAAAAAQLAADMVLAERPTAAEAAPIATTPAPVPAKAAQLALI